MWDSAQSSNNPPWRQYMCTAFPVTFYLQIFRWRFKK